METQEWSNTSNTILHFLKMIGEIEYLIGGMEKTIATVRTFRIGGITTLTKEMDGIQTYNSP